MLKPRRLPGLCLTWQEVDINILWLKPEQKEAHLSYPARVIPTHAYADPHTAWISPIDMLTHSDIFHTYHLKLLSDTHQHAEFDATQQKVLFDSDDVGHQKI